MRISDWSSDVCSSDIFLARPISVPDPQKIAWMHSHPSLRPVGQLLNLVTQFSNRDGLTQNCPSSRCSKRNGQRETDDCPRLVQPPSAGFDFTGIGLGMQPSFAPLFEFELFDRIGDIDLRPVDSRLAERTEQPDRKSTRLNSSH